MTIIMDCERVEGLLHDFVDGSLSSERAELEAHLADCAACRTLADDLERMVTVAASLPVMAPERDLWPEIAARLTPREARVMPFTRRHLTGGSVAGRFAPAEHPRKRARWPIPLAAAAAVLLAATAALTSLREQPSSGPMAVTGDSIVTPASGFAALPTDGDSQATGTAETTEIESIPPSAEPPARPPAAAGVTLASSSPSGSAELLAQSYSADIGTLVSILDTRREVLDTATVSVLERNLSIIDAAIQESREALERDPASPLLTDQLNTAFELKLDILRRAVLLTSGA